MSTPLEFRQADSLIRAIRVADYEEFVKAREDLLALVLRLAVDPRCHLCDPSLAGRLPSEDETT